MSPGRQPRIGILKQHMRLWGAEQLWQQQLEAGTRLVGRVEQSGRTGVGGAQRLQTRMNEQRHNLNRPRLKRR